jgi:predicted anti-sigma-YlaC factor YlaD
VHDPGPPQDGHTANMMVEEVTCQEFVELVTDYFEGTLPSRTLSHVEEHLVMCDWCVTYVEQMQATITVLSELREPPPEEPPELALAELAARRRASA